MKPKPIMTTPTTDEKGLNMPEQNYEQRAREIANKIRDAYCHPEAGSQEYWVDLPSCVLHHIPLTDLLAKADELEKANKKIAGLMKMVRAAYHTNNPIAFEIADAINTLKQQYPEIEL